MFVFIMRLTGVLAIPSICLSISFSLSYRSGLRLSHRRGQGDGKEDKEGGGKLETHHLLIIWSDITSHTDSAGARS